MDNSKSRMIRIRFVSILSIFILFSMFIIITIPVSACHYTVGTFDSDYKTSKESFFKGQIVYCRGNAYNYNYNLKLRIRDPEGNIVYISNSSRHVVSGSFFLNDTALTGIWNVQLGIFIKCWYWSNYSGRISYFKVEDTNFNLTIKTIGNGTVVKDNNKENYSYGSIINLTAIPEKGWVFNNWSDDLSGTDNPKSIIMDSNKTVTANFVQKYYFLNTSVKGNGTVSIEPDNHYYTYGAIVNLTAKPEQDWYFKNWTGNLSGNDNPVSIIMDDDKNITAVFEDILYNLTINIDGRGIVKKNPDLDRYFKGQNVHISAIPDTDWIFDYWSGNISGNNAFVELNMTADKFVTAHFKELEAESGGFEDGGNGNELTIQPSPKQSYVKKSNIPPVAVAGGPYYGFIGENISFNGSNSYDVDHYIKSYNWDFSDGIISEGEIVSHVFSTVGKYKVFLNVTDTKGKTNSNVTFAFVSQPNCTPSKPNISGPTEGFTNIEYVFLIVSVDADNDSINYIVDWGDESQNISGYMPSGKAFELSHIWEKSGIYIINITAEDNETSSNYDIIITINEPKEQGILVEYNIILVILLILTLFISLFLFLFLERFEE